MNVYDTSIQHVNSTSQKTQPDVIRKASSLMM